LARPVDAIAERRVPLSKDRVLRTAMALADQGGIDSLSMRKLAQELGVEAMSLYHYVSSKDDILNGIVEIVVSEIELPDGGKDWKAALRRSAISFHDALARHRWATNLMMSGTGVGTARVRYMDALLGRLREAGFSANMTHHAYHALDSHIMGSTLWAAGYATMAKADPGAVQRFVQKLPLADYPHFAEHVEQHTSKSARDGISEFEFGLDLILDGLEKIRDTAPRRSVPTRRRAAPDPSPPSLPRRTPRLVAAGARAPARSASATRRARTRRAPPQTGRASATGRRERPAAGGTP
jgi:AcrR family transcriptional regulator